MHSAKMAALSAASTAMAGLVSSLSIDDSPAVQRGKLIHSSQGGETLHLNNKRSRDRASRRKGEISARQQRMHRKAAQRALRAA